MFVCLYVCMYVCLYVFLSQDDIYNSSLCFFVVEIIENISLHACNISDGAFLTLHSLGMDKERKNQITIDALKRLHEKTVIDKDIVNVETPITAAQADHSYNGIIFDIESTGPYEINITSVFLAGMLGRVRVFARDKPWEAGPRNSNSNHWWAHQESLSTSGWELVADQVQ